MKEKTTFYLKSLLQNVGNWGGAPSAPPLIHYVIIHCLVIEWLDGTDMDTNIATRRNYSEVIGCDQTVFETRGYIKYVSKRLNIPFVRSRDHYSSPSTSFKFSAGICLFLDGKNGKEDAVSRRSTLARAFAERLQKLIDWFEEQCLHRFVASSLFFCYDWSTPRSDADLILGDSRFIRLHLIDFARWFKVSDTDATASKDENCLHGLYNLRK